MGIAEVELFGKYRVGGVSRGDKRQIKDSANKKNGSRKSPGIKRSALNGFSSYDDFFSAFFYACASQSYDAFFFYHKA